MKRIALLGMPNTGKSTLFNRISGASARVGNWPGITVDLMSAKILLGGHIAELIDLPGIYDLHGYSEDEQVVRHFLTNNPIDLLIVLLNSTQIERQLSLLLQIKKLGVPIVLVLNMADEARRAGITIDTDNLATALALPVIQISAKYGEGLPKALEVAAQLVNAQKAMTNPKSINLLLNEESQIEREMEDLIQKHVQIPATLTDDTTDKIDSILLHKWLGLPLFFCSHVSVISIHIHSWRPATGCTGMGIGPDTQHTA